MCTLTAVQPEADAGAHAPLFRVVVNRDEQRTRAEALPPRLARAGSHDAIFPVDPSSRGTWIGVNTAGLVLGVLNANPMVKPANRPGLRSRGEIVPGLLACDSVTAALAEASQLDPRSLPPFRLVAIERDRLGVLLSDGERLTVQTLRRFDGPFLATSSGLGDHIVEQPRRELFNAAVLRGVSPITDRQDAFHRHCWPERRHVSVEMSRADARTVSRTVVEVYRDSISLTYRALQEAGAGTPMTGLDSHAETSRWQRQGMPVLRYATSGTDA